MYTATCFSNISGDLQNFSMNHNYIQVNIKSLYKICYILWAGNCSLHRHLCGDVYICKLDVIHLK
jgi:hypothetical protein